MLNVRSVLAFLRSTPATANWIGGISLAAWIFKALVFDAIPAPFPQLSALGGVVDGFLSAIVAGYVFFILFALLPEFRARKVIAPYINDKVRWIVGDCMGVLAEVKRVTGNVIDINSPEHLVLESFSAVRTSVPPNMVTQNGAAVVQATWFQFLDYRRQRTKKAIANLINQNRFIEVELITILTEIDGCSYFYQVEACLGMPVRNPDLSFLGGVFWKYIVICRKLAGWHDAKRLTGSLPLLNSV